MVVIVYATIQIYLKNNNCNQVVKDSFENWSSVIEKK